jgi:glycine betaine/proline transport system permease protein
MDGFRIPLGAWVEAVLSYLRNNWSALFDILRAPIAWVETILRTALLDPHPAILVLILAVILLALGGRRPAAVAAVIGLAAWLAAAAIGYLPLLATPTWSSGVAPWMVWSLFLALAWRLAGWQTALFTVASLLLVGSMELWPLMMRTLSLTLTATVLTLVIAIPLGILAAKIEWVNTVMKPMLDFMQTMPAYVYLLPAVMLFGLGAVPATIGTIIFAFPPPVRLTFLGLRQVPKEITEAAEAFGCTPLQKLVKAELPAAMPSIMAGVNQCLMLSLSMVVIASLIGAPGLGSEVLRGLQRLLIGRGFEAGLGIVILAIILDRLIQGAQQTWQQRKRKITSRPL